MLPARGRGSVDDSILSELESHDVTALREVSADRLLAHRLVRDVRGSPLLVLRAVVATVFTAVVASGNATMPALFLLGFLLGLAAPFFDNASGSVLPELVGQEQFLRANSLTQTALVLSGNMVGPMLGTVMYVLWPASPFAFAAVAFATGAIITFAVARRDPGTPAHTGDASVLELLKEGLVALVRDRPLLTLAAATGVINFAVTGAVAVMVLYVLQLMALPESVYGVVIAAFAGGALLGAVLSGRLTKALGERTIVQLCLGGFGLSLVVLGAFPQVGIAFAAVAFMGVFSMVWNITVNTYRQRVTPPALLGRVTSVYRMVSFIAMPLGALVAGLLTHASGLQWTYAAGGLLLLITAAASIPALRSMPNLRSGAEARSGDGDDLQATSPTPGS